VASQKMGRDGIVSDSREEGIVSPGWRLFQEKREKSTSHLPVVGRSINTKNEGEFACSGDLCRIMGRGTVPQELRDRPDEAGNLWSRGT